MFTYTAKVYFDTFEIANRSGDNLELLFIWMLSQVQGKFGNLSGKLTNNKTHFIEREFCTCSYD